MLQHQQRETAECYARPENKTNQIAVKELRAIDERANQQDHGEHNPNDQRAHAGALQFRWWCVAEVHIGARASLPAKRAKRAISILRPPLRLGYCQASSDSIAAHEGTQRCASDPRLKPAARKTASRPN